jgi:hypothetical protein
MKNALEWKMAQYTKPSARRNKTFCARAGAFLPRDERERELSLSPQPQHLIEPVVELVKMQMAHQMGQKLVR